MLFCLIDIFVTLQSVKIFVKKSIHKPHLPPPSSIHREAARRECTFQILFQMSRFQHFEWKPTNQILKEPSYFTSYYVKSSVTNETSGVKNRFWQISLKKRCSLSLLDTIHIVKEFPIFQLLGTIICNGIFTNNLTITFLRPHSLFCAFGSLQKLKFELQLSCDRGK